MLNYFSLQRNEAIDAAGMVKRKPFEGPSNATVISALLLLSANTA